MNHSTNNAGEKETSRLSELLQDMQSVRLHPESRLAEIATDVQNAKEVAVSPREIIGWFGAKRRGVNVVAMIREAFKQKNLITNPDFEYEYIDGLVIFQLASNAESPSAPEPDSETDDSSSFLEEPSTLLNEGLITTDPTYRLGKLPAANHKPVMVHPDDSINKAVTLMMEHDFSQLPVQRNVSSVEGMFTWESLANRLHFGHSPTKVGECMERAHVISSELSIFDAVAEVTQNNVVLVRANNKLITGIVTTFDLSRQFRQLGEPFLLLGEIENQVRRILDGCFTLEELTKIRDETDTDREVTSLSDLTFGEYLRLIENGENWGKLAMPLDRPEFVKKLDDVRVIRNNVMHFDPDGIDDSDIDTLRKFARFMQRIADMKHSTGG